MERSKDENVETVIKCIRTIIKQMYNLRLDACVNIYVRKTMIIISVKP